MSVYEGRFASEELGVEWTIAATDTSISLQRPRAPAVRLMANGAMNGGLRPPQRLLLLSPGRPAPSVHGLGDTWPVPMSAVFEALGRTPR